MSEYILHQFSKGLFLSTTSTDLSYGESNLYCATNYLVAPDEVSVEFWPCCY